MLLQINQPNKITWLIIIGVLITGLSFYMHGSTDPFLNPNSEINTYAKMNRKIGRILIGITFLLACVMYYYEHHQN